MTLSDDQLEALMDAMEQDYGERPSRQEAMAAGMRVLALMELLSTPFESESDQSLAPTLEAPQS